MNIKILDCTLRDGGYQNDWQFGNANIKKTIQYLTDAQIDIIECGFLTHKENHQSDRSVFNTIGQIANMLTVTSSDSLYVAMLNYGEFDPASLPQCDGSVGGLRVAFHKNDLKEALEVCRAIQDKGYKVFVQPMVSLSYTDVEFLSLIEQVNELKPFAFYIVDSFGNMNRRNLLRFLCLTDKNLSDDIMLGYHGHNNTQRAGINAMTVLDSTPRHSLIFDVSVYGMGRGAGNLNLELFAEDLNMNYGKNYNIKPILKIMDEVLNDFYKKSFWGYSLSNYISAKYNVHPNYGEYVENTNKFPFESFDEIISLIAPEKRDNFDRGYIAQLCLQYMKRGESHEANIDALRQQINGNTVVIICPGLSSETEKDRIVPLVEQNVSISVNFDYEGTDYIFVSNPKRYAQLENAKTNRVIATSNITALNAYCQPAYSDLLNDVATVEDNAGLMAVKFAISLGASKIMIAGMDGYSHDQEQNYGDTEMTLIMKNALLDAMNAGMSEVMDKYSKQTTIEFITTSKRITIGDIDNTKYMFYTCTCDLQYV
jgi:4-hydroxy 2-oxovalerate aldolase